LKSRHGKGVIKSTGDRAAQCQSVGDFEGAEIWLRVKTDPLYIIFPKRNSSADVGHCALGHA
jgi:hypothetical protein